MVDLIDDRNGLLIKDIWGYVKNDSFLIAYRKLVGNDQKDSTRYWLIQTGRDSVYGPFDVFEYKRERLKLNVQPSLILDFARDSVVRY